jgi:histidyl-tRNA synthetase
LLRRQTKTEGLSLSLFQDFDIAGQYDPMLPDVEILVVAVEVLSALKIGEFTIKVRQRLLGLHEFPVSNSILLQINHRKLLDGIFSVCGTPADKIRPISSAVDKLDKVYRLMADQALDGCIDMDTAQLPWEDVRKEMTEEKGLDGEVADRIGEYVKLKGENSDQILSFTVF